MGWCGSAAGSCHTVCPCSDVGHVHSVRPRAASDKAWCIFMSADLSYVSPAVAGCSVKLRIILHMQGPLFPEKRRPAGASARCSRRVAGEGAFFSDSPALFFIRVPAFSVRVPVFFSRVQGPGFRSRRRHACVRLFSTCYPPGFPQVFPPHNPFSIKSYISGLSIVEITYCVSLFLPFAPGCAVPVLLTSGRRGRMAYVFFFCNFAPF